ncbi:hypothetical protein M8C21_006228, partial [Ambrosia artemisiifolia]
VALHLLSEKEKNEMAQLVRTMVSYAITYRNKKVDPLPGKSRNQASTDAQILSFDPPIGDFVNFEGYSSNCFMLASAVKQVLSHEVEKQKILQSSIGKSKDENERTYLSGKENSSKPDHAPENTKTSISNLKNSSAPNRLTSTPANTMVSATASGRSATSSIEISKPSETTKKRSGGSFNFFERFRKTSANGSQMTETVKKVSATLERDSRPVLFKFNEGFTNAVKRPVRMRELLM